MKYRIKWSAIFKKQYKLMMKRGVDITLLDNVVRMLAAGEKLPSVYRDHSLSGKFNGLRECHIRPDWLLVYCYCEDELILTLSRTGSHSDIFGL